MSAYRVKPTIKSFPYDGGEDRSNLGHLIVPGRDVEVAGRVQRVTPGWAGRVRCELLLSIGTLMATADRETLPHDVVPGSWMQGRVQRSVGTEPSVCRLVNAARAEEVKGTCWTPSGRFHRKEHMTRLRHLLGMLDVDAQAFWMSVVSDSNLQSAMYFRIAALDHHVYPGGLFDHSVTAAETAFASSGGDLKERSAAALSALLFDIGKVSDPRAERDAGRVTGLSPHSSTRRLLDPVIAHFRTVSSIAGDVETLLWGRPETLTDRARRAQRVVSRAVLQSWTLGA